jgi:hypothetical protein
MSDLPKLHNFNRFKFLLGKQSKSWNDDSTQGSSTSLGPHAEQPRLGFFEPQEFVALDLERVLEQPPHRPEQSAIA